MKALSRLLKMLGVLLLAAGALLIVGPAQAAQTATVSVLHGIPDATVDVYVNGDQLLKNFKPGTLTDPQSLPAASYDVKVVKAGDGADADAVVEAKDVKVPAGGNITVVAHLSDDGEPSLTPFVNDVSRLDPGQARAVVRHTAAAPAVDIRAGGDPVFTDLSNPDEDSADIDAGTIKADVVLAGTEDVVIGPASLKLGEGAATFVYAWGSAEDDNLKLAVQTINDLHGNPQGVPGGTGGQAASLASSPWSIGLLTVGLAGVALSGAQLVRSRVATRR